MEAVINVKGFQIPVKRGQRVIVPYLGLEEGEIFEVDAIMSVEGDRVSFEKKRAKLKVLGEKDEKLIIFKMKRKNNYRRMYFHVQKYTVVRVEDIV